MSKVKTRNEIKAEAAELSEQIAALKTANAEKVQAFEAQIETLNAELEQAKAALVESDKAMEAKTEEVAGLNAELETVRADALASLEAKAAAEAELEKACNALANPAFADAATVPHTLDQAQADAEANLSEAKALVEVKEPLSMSDEEFRKLSPIEMNDFFRKGGKIKV